MKTQLTIDHAAIQRWVEARGGQPATKAGTAPAGESVGILRVRFPETNSERVDVVTWEEFFAKFEEKALAFVLRERTRDGQLSRYCRFVRREK